MKKPLLIIFGIIVILSLAAILVWNLVPSFVSHRLSKEAGVSVTISDLDISPKQIKVEGIRVGNPKGYSKTPRAMSCNLLSLSIPLTEFFKKDIVIENMTLDDVYIGLEFDSPKSTQGNWTVIMNNVSQSTKKEQDKAKSKGKGTTVLIKKLIITDLQIELAYKTGGKANQTLRPIDRIELTNVSSEGGIPTSQIMNIVMQETLRNIFSKEGLQNMLEGVINPNGSEGIMNSIKGLFSDLIILDNDWETSELAFEEAQ